MSQNFRDSLDGNAYNRYTSELPYYKGSTESEPKILSPFDSGRRFKKQRISQDDDNIIESEVHSLPNSNMIFDPARISTGGND